MPSSSLKARLEELARKGGRCEVPGCHRPRQKIGRFCEQHDKANEATGHPEGRTIRKGELRLFQENARAFLDGHQDHSHVQTALKHLRGALEAAQLPNRIQTPQQRISLWLHRLKAAGVTPEDMLAAIVGMFLLREDDPSLFKSDRHFNHQLVTRVLRLAPAPYVTAWKSGEPYRMYHRIGVKLREVLGRFFVSAAGVVGVWAAKEIHQDHERTLLEQIINHQSKQEHAE